MAFYTSIKTNTDGKHTTLINTPFPGCVEVPNELINEFLSCKGYATLHHSDGVVNKIDPIELPDFEKEVHPEPVDPIQSLRQENKLLKAQTQMQSEQITFLEECILEMAEVVYA